MPEEHVTDLERDLAVLLAVEPSPAFAAGVRARLADDGDSRGWMRWALAAAAVVVVIAGAMLTWTSGTSAPELAPPTLTRAANPVVSASPTADEPLKVVRKQRTRMARAVGQGATDPEVIIDPALNLAMQRLLGAAQQGRADAEALDAALKRSDALPQDLSVAPVVVDDVVVPVIKLGESQIGGRQ